LAYVYVRRPLSTALWLEALGEPLEEGSEDGYAFALLDELAEMSERTYGICAEKIVAEGTPARQIARIADERHVDAVVVGCSRRLLHRIAGSTARWLVSHGNWPVMVVP
jgi:nucleotide-binding universal stress UspA family protein